MFCVQESDSHADPFSNDKDPLSTNQSESSDEEPSAKRLKTYTSPSLNLKVYQIPAYSTPKSLSIFPVSPSTQLPKFVNNPLNLANPLALATNNTNNVVKSLHSRYSLPAKLTITPVQTPAKTEIGEIVRYKKNGEIAKKRGPPKGYKRKPKVDLSCSLTNGALLQAQNTILTSLLAADPALAPRPPPAAAPRGTELVELDLDPEDWFPTEPYKMVFSRKKNPKWKSFPYRCEHCFKGYRVASTLIQHAAERHGSVPRELAIPCPCCPHVSTRRKLHKKHLESHESRKHRIFCLYCLPPPDPKEPYVKESEKYPYDKFPQYWYASEESLRLHKKRKHPEAAMFNYNWFATWADYTPNS
ncbi:uncharacterized protein LOC128682562 [Plodia interpunctella]|uniref:uncharacterized protein LOC128682562 n=1 Tax=Plodia interpunctella TaxID=58824 RepID=UPI0023675AD7|nr:uncharacterized protein LOC128682562 [Plodia interpunctella]XP_053623324.1 uncharacterized protein LOC128682562 [Plodia interpunctella]